MGTLIRRVTIGDSYKEWLPYQKVFISSPTGSGKTTFILNVYLPFLISQNKRMLYMVNRSILKEQLQKEIGRRPYYIQEAVTVELYQEMENKLLVRNEAYPSGSGYQNMDLDYSKYTCIVCDEAHYFLTDSLYNTNTILSYNYIREKFLMQQCIFMSATIGRIQEFIQKDLLKSKIACTTWFRIQSRNITQAFNQYPIIMDNRINFSKACSFYTIERDYSYVNIHIINSRDDIVETVKSEKKKWLIFVDDKKLGKSLKAKMEDQKIGKRVEFISSGYRDDPGTSDEVNEIVDKNKTTADILITTSVLDNGVDLKDEQLKNVLIIADTEEEFIQMLGRVRRSETNIELYIMKLDIKDIQNRFIINRKRADVTRRYRKSIDDVLKPIEQDNLGPLDTGKIPANPDYSSIVALNKKEKELMSLEQCKLLRSLLNSQTIYECVKAAFLSYGGLLCLSLLSFENIEYLNQFYGSIIEKFNAEGEDAFLRIQLGWLNKTEVEATQIISESKEKVLEKNKTKLIDALESIVGKSISVDKNIEFKRSVHKTLIWLLEEIGDEEAKRYCREMNKNERPISVNQMNFLMEHYKLPYEMEIIRAKRKSKEKQPSNAEEEENNTENGENENKKGSTYILKRKQRA